MSRDSACTVLLHELLTIEDQSGGKVSSEVYLNEVEADFILGKEIVHRGCEWSFEYRCTFMLSRSDNQL